MPTYAEEFAQRHNNGNLDPTKPPELLGRGPGDYDALWHFAASTRAWGELGWLRAKELEAQVAELEAAGCRSIISLVNVLEANNQRLTDHCAKMEVLLGKCRRNLEYPDLIQQINKLLP